MPTYEFEDEQGQRVELFLSIGEAPSFGEWGEFGGRRLRRVVETPVAPHVPDYTCIVRSQARWTPGAKRYDAQGHGVILSKKEHQEYKAHNPHLGWD